MSDQNEFIRIEADLQKYFKLLPKKVGGWAVEFFKGSFDRQGFIDTHYERWAMRNKNAKRNDGRKLLIDSGRLRRSIKVISTTSDTVTIGSDVVYAETHNEGLTINYPPKQRVINFRRRKDNQVRFAQAKKATFSQKVSGRGHSVKMPKRQFIGQSDLLEKRIAMRIEKDILNIFNK